MSATLSEDLHEIITETTWPEPAPLTPQSQAAYEQGMDILNLYRGDPQTLLEGLKVFRASGTLAYAAAGCSAALMLAAYESGDQYSAAGLALAQPWLQKAQTLAPGRAEIDTLEADWYLYRGQKAQTRAVLDRLTAQTPWHFYLCLSEMYYWYMEKNRDQYQRWYDRALPHATTPPRQICLFSRAAGFYFARQEWDTAIAIYRRLAKLDPKDPWLWHNLSLAYYHLQKYDDSRQCNREALRLMDFAGAREMEQVLKKKLPFWKW